jgi:peroxiredoxin Q/BCP
MLAIGDTAPDFTLPNQNGDAVSLANFKGKWLVLYFYPRAMTPGCTTQACMLRDHQKQLNQLNAAVVGVSPDSPAKMKKFEEKEGLNFILLGDETHEMLESYGVWQEKSMYGRKYMGVVRATYIISPNGKISKIIPKVSVKTHHEDVISWLKENSQEGAAA